MFKSTTIVSVRHKGKVAIAGDGQVSLGNTVMKHNAKKIRKIYNDKILTGFAGASADAFALFSRFEEKLSKHNGNLQKSTVELAKDWRTDKILRRLEALLLVADVDKSFVVSGTGDVIEPDDGIVAIGSGGVYAQAAAKALIKHSDLSACEIAQEALMIASQICIYTNSNISIEELE